MTASRRLVFGLLWAPTSWAAGPDSFGYYVYDSTSGPISFDPALTADAALHGTDVTTIDASDDGCASVSLPFTFPFYDTDYTSTKVCGNGYLQFGTGSPPSTYSNQLLSNASSTYPSGFPIVAPFWDDLFYSAGATYVRYYSAGTTPDQTFTVAWYRNHYNFQTGFVQFSATLYEADGSIVFQYPDVDFGNANYDGGRSATIGIDGGTTAGYYSQYSYNTRSVADNDAIWITSKGPAVASAGGPYSGAEGVAVPISAVGGSSSGTLTSVSLDCDSDGTYEYSDAAGFIADCFYGDDGPYFATVAVADSLGFNDTDITSVAVENIAPELSAFESETAFDVEYVGDNLRFYGMYEGDEALGVYCAATDVAADTVTISYDWGDGTSELGAGELSLFHTYTDDGTYFVSCSAFDEDGGSTLDLYAPVLLWVEVENAPPTLVLAASGAAAEGEPVAFEALATDPGDDALDYTWDFGDGTSGAGATLSHVYAAPGSYFATVSVIDGDGGTDTEIVTVLVADGVPTVSLLSVEDGEEGEELAFTATASAGATDTLTYAWDFGDGSAGSGNSTTHTFADNGRFSVVLSVWDDDGNVVSSSATSVVANADPVVTIGAPSGLLEGDTGSFSASIVDPGVLDTHTFLWDFGDGESSTDAAPAHAFSADGTYIISLVATDDDGGVGSASTAIVVANATPEISEISAPEVEDEGSPVHLAAAATDGGGDPLVYSWDFGDGDRAVGDDVWHTWVDDGLYLVTVSAMDDTGASTSEIFPIEIVGVAPVMAVVPPPDALEGDLLPFSATALDAGVADPITYSWTFGDGSSGSAAAVSHGYADEGAYTVAAVASDEDGLSDSAEFLINIDNVAPTISSPPPTVAAESSAFDYFPTATDPGTADVLTWSLDVGPATATINAAAGALSWLPAFSDTTAPVDFTISVSDGDGGSDSQTFSVAVAPLDSDGDGMSDGYELAHGFDPANPADGAADADGDGVSNADEAAASSDPTAYDGPAVPVLVSPIDGEVVASLFPNLVAGGATSPRGLALTYDFEVYADASLSSLVAEMLDEPESSGSAQGTPEVSLAAGADYWWRARANDGIVAGEWAEAEDFSTGGTVGDTGFDTALSGDTGSDSGGPDSASDTAAFGDTSENADSAADSAPASDSGGETGATTDSAADSAAETGGETGAATDSAADSAGETGSAVDSAGDSGRDTAKDTATAEDSAGGTGAPAETAGDTDGSRNGPDDSHEKRASNECDCNGSAGATLFLWALTAALARARARSPRA